MLQCNKTMPLVWTGGVAGRSGSRCREVFDRNVSAGWPDATARRASVL